MKLLLQTVALASFFILTVSFAAQAEDIGIYVTNNGSDDVSVIDPADNTVTTTLDVGADPQGIAALPDGSAVYVANNGDDDVSIIDTSDNTVEAGTIAVGNGPVGVAANPDGTEVYVTNQNDDTVSVIDVDSGTVTATIGVGDDPRGIAVNPDGTEAYVANAGGDSVSVIDLSSNTVTATIALDGGSAPRDLIVNNAGDTLFVTGFLTNEVYEITTSNNTVADEVAVGIEPLGLAITADDDTLYALNALTNNVSVITTSDFTVSTTLTATNFPRQGVLSTDEATLYTTEQFGDVVSIINVGANTKTTLAVGTTPFGIAFAKTAVDSDVAFTVTTELAVVDLPGVSGDAYTNPFYTSKAGNLYTQDGKRYFVVLTVTNTGSTDATTSFINPPFSSQDRLALFVSGVVGTAEVFVYDDLGTLQQSLDCTESTNCALGLFAAGETKVIKVVYEGSEDCSSFICSLTQTDELIFTIGSDSAGISDDINVSVPFAEKDYVSCGCKMGGKTRPLGPTLMYILFFMGALIMPIAILRFRNSKLFSILFILGLSLLANSAHAETSRYSLLSDTPILGSTGAIYTLGTKTISNLFNFTFENDFGHGFRRTALNKSGLTENLLAHNIAISYSPFDRWQFDAIVPVVLWNYMYNTSNGTTDNKAGIGDIELRAHVNFLRSKDDSRGLALIPFLSIPTDTEDKFIGDDLPRGGMKLSGDWQMSDRFYSALNLGFEAREPVSDVNYKHRGRFLTSVGGTYKVSGPFSLISDLFASTAMNHPFADKTNTSLELMGGAKYSLKNHPTAFNLSAGGPIIQTALQPEYRINLGVTFGFKKKKSEISSREKQEVETSFTFENNSSNLSPADQARLNRIAEILQKHPDVQLVVAEGHTDSKGKHRPNQKLSIQRAMAVKNYLTAHSVSAARIQAVGLAETKPAASNATPKGRSQNRRVELHITKQGY